MSKRLAFADVAPSLGDALVRLAETGRLADPARAQSMLRARADHKDMPLYVRAIIGVGTTVGCWLIVGALAAAGMMDGAAAALGFGITLMVAAVVLMRSGRLDAQDLWPTVALQASFALMAAGKVMVTAGAGFLMDGTWGAFLGAALATALAYPIYKLWLDRFLSVLGTLFLLQIAVLEGGGLDLTVRATLLPVAFGLQVFGAGVLAAHPRTGWALRPMALALAGGAVSVLIMLEMGAGRGLFEVAATGWALPYRIPAASALVMAAFWAFGRRDHALSMPAQGATLAAAALGAIAPPGVSVALAVIVLGHTQGARLWVVMGTLVLPVFLTFHYYNLAGSLMVKAGHLAATGAVLLLVAAVAARYRRGFGDVPDILDPVLHPPRAPRLVGVAIALLALVPTYVVAEKAWTKEQIWRTGDTVFFELAPVDPRTLMMGDYMTLTYGFTRDIDRHLRDGDLVIPPGRTKVVVSVDQDRVATFARLHAGEEMEDGEMLLNVGWEQGRVVPAATKFFFQEGTGETFDQARFAVLKLDADGSAALVGLADADRVPLGTQTAGRDAAR